jgi:hypothetical protein
MDPISLTIFGSLVAAIPTAFMAGVVAPRAATAAVTPGLEVCRQHLRKEEGAEKLRRDAALILGILTTPATEEEDNFVNGVLDAVDWPLTVAGIGGAKNLPVGPASGLRPEEVWPLPKEQTAVLTEGEEKILQTLLNKEDRREYALVLRRVMQWTDRRKAVLGL